MLDDVPVKVGDELVECGKVYKVFKIADKQSFEGKVEKHVFFKPVYDSPENNTLSCTVPLKNIAVANIRRPLSKKEVAEILGFEGLQFPRGELVDMAGVKEILRKNDAHANARVLKSLWKEVKGDEEPTKSKKDMLALSFESLIQEVALAYGISLETAQSKLEKALENS